MKCNCGSDVERMKVYFHRESGLRVTVCNDCEREKKLVDNKDFYTKELKDLTQEDNKTPEPNAVNK